MKKRITLGELTIEALKILGCSTRDLRRAGVEMLPPTINAHQVKNVWFGSDGFGRRVAHCTFAGVLGW